MPCGRADADHAGDTWDAGRIAISVGETGLDDDQAAGLAIGQLGGADTKRKLGSSEDLETRWIDSQDEPTLEAHEVGAGAWRTDP